MKFNCSDKHLKTDKIRRNTNSLLYQKLLQIEITILTKLFCF